MPAKIYERRISMPENEKQVFCLRCNTPMEYVKEYRFDSQDAHRGILGTIFDWEEHLSFNIYVCPHCRHTEFFYTGSREGFDDWIDIG